VATRGSEGVTIAISSTAAGSSISVSRYTV
jgi:hypothetical protein